MGGESAAVWQSGTRQPRAHISTAPRYSSPSQTDRSDTLRPCTHAHATTTNKCQHLRPSGVLRWPGTHSRILSGIQRATQTVLGVYLKRTCSRVTSASSATAVLNDGRLCTIQIHTLTHSRAVLLGGSRQKSLQVRLTTCSAYRWQPWASCSHTRASVTQQNNLVPVKRRWCSAAGKVTVGLVSHWPCVTDFSGLSIYGLMA